MVEGEVKGRVITTFDICFLFDLCERLHLSTRETTFRIFLNVILVLF